MWFEWIINTIFGIGLFVNAALFVPQIIKLAKKKCADNISLTTFIGFCLTQLAAIMYGFIHQVWVLFFGYILALLTCGTVTVLAVYYRASKKKYIKPERSESEELLFYKNMFHSLPEHVYCKDLEGRMLASNLNNARGLGFSSVEELLGKNDYELQGKKIGAIVSDVDKEVMVKGETITVEEVGMTSDPVGTVYLSKKTPLRDEQDNIIGLIGVSFNITQRRDRELQKDKLCEEIIALMPGHVYWTNREGTILGCNDEQAKSAGYQSRNDLIGKSGVELWHLEASDMAKNNNKVIETGQPELFEESTVLVDKQEHVFLSHKVPLHDASNRVIGLLSVSFDITERKKTEELARQASAAEEKSKGMAMIAGSVAHELRTPLRTIESNLEGIKRFFPLLLDGYQAAKKARLVQDELYPREMEALLTAADSSLAEAQSAKLVIDSLLKTINYSGVAQYELKNCKMSICINEALRRYPFKDGQAALVDWDMSHDFEFMGDRLMVIHVLFNLIKNALYYIKAAGKGRIYIWLAPKGNANHLYFKDTGSGMSEDILSHIFDRFFSQTDNGSGVGLAFCRDVLRSFGGDIQCESVKLQFAKFTLIFPSVEQFDDKVEGV